ncbi:hypothetical protein Tco_1462970, partial [Tanacetum coccineum]
MKLAVLGGVSCLRHHFGQFYKSLAYFFGGQDFSRALGEVLKDPQAGLIVRVVPISLFFILPPYAFLWLSSWRLFSDASIHEGEPLGRLGNGTLRSTSPMGKSFPRSLGVLRMIPLPKGMLDGQSSCYTKDSSSELDECLSGCNHFLRDKNYSE